MTRFDKQTLKFPHLLEVAEGIEFVLDLIPDGAGTRTNGLAFF